MRTAENFSSFIASSNHSLLTSTTQFIRTGLIHKYFFLQQIKEALFLVAQSSLQVGSL